MPKQEIKDAGGKTTILLDGDAGDMVVGGNGQRGDLLLKDAAGKTILRISAFGQITIHTADGKQRFFASL